MHRAVHFWCIMSAQLALPPIPLAALPERTKDYILGLCNGSGLTPEQAVKRVLDRAAGVCPPPAVPAGTSESEADTVPMAA